MDAGWAWARSELRRRRGGALALVLLIGVTGAVVLVTAAGSRRTASAFERFLDQSRTADVQLQISNQPPLDEDAPEPTPAEAAAAAEEQARMEVELLADLRAHPSIVTAVPVHFNLAFAEGVDYELAVLSGPRGLFDEVDVPRILDGEPLDLDDPHQVLLNEFTAGLFDAAPGDHITVGTFTADQFGPDGPAGEPAGPVLDLEVSAVVATPYDLADPEFPGIYGTPAFYDEYHSSLAGFGPRIEILTDGASDPEQLVREIVAPYELHEVITGTSDEQTEKVADGTRVLAVGLAAFALVAGLATLVACAQALHRRSSDSARDLPALGAMGLSRGQRAVALTLSVAPVVAAGLALAVLLAVPGSASMPIGVARRAEPSAGIDVDLPLLLGIALVAGILLLAGVAATSWRATGTATAVERSTRRRPVLARSARARLAPAGQVGVAMALDPGGRGVRVPVRSALTGAAFGVAGVIAALTFGAGLDHLTSDPVASGWNWTLRPSLVDEADEGAEARNLATLLEVPGVQDVGRIGIGQVMIEGQGATAVSMQAEAGAPELATVSGRPPASTSEVALGPDLARSLGASAGDDVRIGGLDRPLTVVGEALVPTFDDNAFNGGVVLMPETLDAIRGGEGFDEYVVTFDSAISDEEAAERVETAIPGSVSVYSYPALPPDVANLESVRFLPQLLGAFLAVLALAAVTHALVTSVRRRRVDLGIIRTFGFTTGHVVRTVVAQSITWVVVGLLVGLPLGVAAGRLAWRAVADGIGVTGEIPTPVGALLGVPAVVLAASIVVAVLPGQAAARMRAVEALRVE